MNIFTNITKTVRYQMIMSVLLMICLAAGTATGSENIDPDADRILKSMSDYLGKTDAFSVKADTDFEIIAQTGQKFQLSSYVSVVVDRPSKFHITRKGMIADVAVIYDGKTLTLHGRNLNAYARTTLSGTINDAIFAYELETGIPAPGADFLFSDAYAILSSGIEKGIYVGKAYVNGVECHHLAFREAKIDWQVWVKTGDEPLPMKYVITTKWLTGAPQYELRFRDWNRQPVIKADQFSFSVPTGAVKLERLPINEMGEFTSNKEEK